MLSGEKGTGDGRRTAHMRVGACVCMCGRVRVCVHACVCMSARRHISTLHCISSEVWDQREENC